MRVIRAYMPRQITTSTLSSSILSVRSKDTTVITVAHRLQTIIDSDRVVGPGWYASRVPTRYPQMVLDSGRLVEFDKPAVLYRDQGLLKAMVDESMDREKLRKMAGL
jgi:ABC-type transport system involved in cytochrome bd biosynthesis fused ATPase/permease subunit